MIVRIAAILAALVLGLPAAARADWMVGAFLGHAWTLSSTVTLALPAQQTSVELSGVEYRGESFRSPQYYGLRGAWIPSARRWISIEGEWIHAKVFSETSRSVHAQGTLRGVPIDADITMRSFVQRLAMSHGMNFLLANVALRREVGPVDAQGARRLVAIVRAGAGPMLPHAESTIDQIGRDQYETGGLGMQVGGGLEFSIWKGLGALGEYKFTRAKPEIDVSGGQATIPATSHHLVFGVSYGF
jgi:hypothetical protein